MRTHLSSCARLFAHAAVACSATARRVLVEPQVQLTRTMPNTTNVIGGIRLGRRQLERRSGQRRRRRSTTPTGRRRDAGVDVHDVDRDGCLEPDSVMRRAAEGVRRRRERPT